MESKPNSHEIEPVPQDCEDNGRGIEDQSPSDREEYYDITEVRILFNAALKDNWKVAEPILNKDPNIVREKISNNGETLLHVAAIARRIGFVRKLMNMMEAGDLELKDACGYTAFFRAAASGFIEIAEAMRERNNNLPNIPGNNSNGEVFPITSAATLGYKTMVSYLFEVTNLDMLQLEERLLLLQYTIQYEMYEVALNIFNKDRILLATKILEGNDKVLYTLSQKSLAISNQGGNLKRFIIGACSPVWRKLIPWNKRYILKTQAGVLLEELWAECQRSGENKLLKLVEKENLVHSAAKAGNLEFLLMVTRDYPNLIWRHDDENDQTIFHVAVLYREEKVFSLIHQIGAIKDLVILHIDNDGNNILHLAAKLGQPICKQKIVQYVPPNNADNNVVLQHLFQQIIETQSVKEEKKIMPPSFLRVSGAALQMQREILWFKEVEKMVPSIYHKRINNNGKTPRELFTEEHKLLLKEGESWMKHTAQSCMIVATLIATMVFSACFTVPGGNRGDNGIPIWLNLNGFTVFVISDAVALFSSIVSIIMFLSILTSRYAEDDFLVSLPAKLLFGLTMLFVSIGSTLLTFAATFFLVYSNRTGWEPKLIAVCAGVPIALFGCLQYKLWFDVAKSTYWSKFLFRSGSHKLD